MKKLKTVFLLTFAVSIFLIGGCVKSFTDIKPTPEVPLYGLKGVGINSMLFWSGTSKISSAESALHHLSPVETHGFSHIVLISCADWIIGLQCKKYFQTKENVIRVARLLVSQTNLHVVISLKAYKQKKIDGHPMSNLNNQLEKSSKVQKSFIAAWADIAEQLSDVPRERLSFNLLNEPEFQFPKPSNSKRKAWEKIASDTIKAIRKISPDRVIIYEGIRKSLLARRFKKGNKKGNYKYSMDLIIQPLDFRDIVYGVHNYEPGHFLQQAKYRSGTVGKPHTESITQSVIKDADRLSKWANKHNVPVILSETGCIGYVDGKTEGPKNPNDCGKYAADVYNAYVKNGIPVTWWALEKEKTIYKRDSVSEQKWMPDKRIPDEALFKGFQLKID